MKTQSKTLNRSALWVAIIVAIGLAWSNFAVAASDDDDEADSAKKVEELTQVKSEIEFGMCYVSDDSFRFGRYNGLDDDGLHALLNFDFYHRDPYDAADPSLYWRLTGNNVGLDTRTIGAEIGEQGTWRAHAEYDQIPYNRADDTRTIYDGAGGNTLTLPSGWVGGQTTAAMTRLLPSLQGFDVESERRRTSGGVDYQLDPKWSFSSNVRHETKDGIKTLGATFGNSGGNPRAVLIPEPIDYQTDEVELAARYFTKKWQLQLSYYGSFFDDHNAYVSFQNPYTTITGWAASSGYPTGVGQMGTPPDNQFNQITLDGGYNFSDLTRLSASVSRGRMTQDVTFLPYTANPTLQAQITRPLPRDSLDGKIDTTGVLVRITSHPWDTFAWTAQYKLDDRDNKTPVDKYVYVGGDTQVQLTGEAVDRVRFNEPYSYKDQSFKADASWRPFHRTTFAIGAEHKNIDRTYSEREKADENSFRAEVRTEMTDWLSGYVRWTHAKRDGSTYNGAEPIETGYTPQYAATLPGGFENAPGLRKFNQADRTRDIASAFVSVTPWTPLTLSAGVDYALDDYDKSDLGLVLSRVRSHTFDAVWAPTETWSAYGFFTHEKMDADQDGRSLGGATRVADSVNPLRSWFAFHRDTLDTEGLGVKHTFTDHRIDVSADYVHSWTRSNIYTTAGTLLTFRPLPQAKTKLDSVGVAGSWQCRDDLAFKLRFWRERYNSIDWQIDSLVPNQLANVITLGERAPDYKVNVVFASMVYRF